MHPIIYYIIFFLAIGAVGMAIANRKVGPVLRKQRWLKYFTYIIFTSIVIAGIFYNFFYILAWIISTASFFELLKINFSKPIKSFLQITVSFFVFLTVVTGFILFAYISKNSFLLFIYFQILVFDGFCQITGQLFGKHQLAPKVSPTKTWEGLIGGWLCCIGAAIMGRGWVSIPLPESMLFGLLTGFTSFTGDFLASYYKRKVQVKDYSNWLPGQGGFLDRFDSFLFAVAIYYLLKLLFKSSFDFLIEA
jgi:phosphatidate cytidylyltransferase